MSVPLQPFVTQLKAAAEPTRLRLLTVCAAAELTVTELTRILGQSQPRVSRHLRKLCDAGLLLRFREAHFVYYRVPAAGQPRRLVASLLAGLSREDETVRRDLDALARVQTERAERARAVMAQQSGDAPDARDDALSDERVADALLAMTDLTAIGDLLDIGTGTGRILELFGPHARSAVGVDISADMLLVARSTVQAAGLNSVMVRHGDMYRLPYPDDTFDTVTVDHVLAEAERPGRVLAEAGRILRPGGQMIVVDLVDRESNPRFGDGEPLRRWANDAGLTLGDLVRLDGETRTVVLSRMHLADNNEHEAA